MRRKKDGTEMLLKKFKIPATRKNYLNLAFAGKPPEPMDGEVERMLPRDYVMESLKKKYPRKKITAEMYIGAQGLEPGDFEAELTAAAPEELQEGIQRLADDAREEKRNRPYRAHRKPRTDFMM